MNVLFAVWELDPFIKVGGLGDVARSLPAALREMGVDIRVVIPSYKVLKLGRCKKTKVGDIQISFAGKEERVHIYQVFHPDNKVPVFLLYNPRYLSIPIFPDTFAFFSKAIVQIIKENRFPFVPDIIHCNDLHTSIIPLLIRGERMNIKTMLTIHNLSYQGKTSLDILKKMEVDEKKCRVIHWEIDSYKLNFLLEGIVHADVITTVSPTYAKEIMTEEFGVGLEEILRGKEGRVFGILNGIDNVWRHIWHVKHVKYPFISGVARKEDVPDRVYSWEEGKRLNKIYLQKKLGLRMNAGVPFFGFIGRFDPVQKGIDILHKMLRRDDIGEFQLVILGSGNHDWEERFQWFSKFYPKSISCNFEFNEGLAHQIYAAADFLLIPSKFEPCGLIQMIAMYFGAIPIVHKTGGLIDSVKDGKNGFVFEQYSSEALQRAVEKALDMWKHNKPAYRQMVQNAFDTDFSWTKSAREYFSLYTKLVNNTL